MFEGRKEEGEREVIGEGEVGLWLVGCVEWFCVCVLFEKWRVEGRMFVVSV